MDKNCGNCYNLNGHELKAAKDFLSYLIDEQRRATMAIKIKEVYVDHILFSDNSLLVTAHEQDCCAHTYADFSQLEDLAKDYTFTPLYNLLSIEKWKGGFRFGDEKRMIFVPCYSMQNVAYSNMLEVFLLNEGVKFYSCDVYCDTYDDSDGELIERGEYYDN